MKRCFNITGACYADRHYMVDLSSRLEKIKVLIEQGAYFTINRARQYGKTTMLNAIKSYFQDSYLIINMDFQMFSHANFEREDTFVKAFIRELFLLLGKTGLIPTTIAARLKALSNEAVCEIDMGHLFAILSDWCAISSKPIVLLIDEIDSATNNQVFLDFLSQLRGYYLHREERPTFRSVILAGVYDVKNIKQKIRQETEHKRNSPWNIATEFHVDMSFSLQEIANMLADYESDIHTGMKISEMAALLSEYTSGYPFLVSRLCKLIDEEIAGTDGYPKKAAWSYSGFQEAIKRLLAEKNTLFESMVGKLEDYPELKDMVYQILFNGKTLSYHPLNPVMEIATMFGIFKNDFGTLSIANRIFETILYNLFLTSAELQSTDIYSAALRDKNQFLYNGRLNMDLLLEKYVIHFDELYGDQPNSFKEEDGRRYFLLYLRPIINGTGTYYIESRTRNMERTDVIIDYQGEQFIIELKIWHGNAYQERGEQQLIDYLDHYHLKKGYLLSYCFNKTKQIGVRRVVLGDKVLIEAVV